MKKRHLFFVGFLSLFVFYGCGNAPFQKTDDGIIVNLSPEAPLATKKLQLQVITDDIIHVTATPAKEFPKKKSLITVYDKTQTSGWTAEEKDGQVVLKTAALMASVSLATGEVVFSDLDGNPILSEEKGGGKTFTAIEVEGKKAYSMQQVFESDADEAFYGLGQHQADEFNYKGKNEELFQYNTKVSVPFVVSTKNYGILWDNYSLSRFGDSRPYKDINQFNLYDKNGNAGGLTAVYMADKNDATNVFVERVEPTIDYENIKTIKNFPEKFPFDNAKVVWEGEIESKESGLYHFNLYYAGYITVSIDGKVVVPERWRTSWNPNSFKFTADMKAGERRKIKLEWLPDGGISYMGLKALSPRTAEEQNKLAIWSEMGDEIDYYFIKGNSMDEVVKGYRTITGKAQVMPKWAMGYWQSRERYRTQDEMLAVVKEFRKLNIPLDNIVLDWNYWEDDQWGSHEFDKKRFPDPKGMVDSIHAMNARMMISVWPKFYANTEHFKEFEKNGWMYMRAVEDSIKDWVGPGYVGSFYDAYSADARKLFWKQMNEHLFSLGIDAWWMDASEPNVRDCTDMDYRKALCGPTALGSSTEYFNAYALMNAEAIYDGQREADNNKRVFLLTRSGFAGIQRYSTAVWSGDIATRWEDMKAQISAGLNFAMAGVPFWTMDIGGFSVEKRYMMAKEGSEDLKEWRELNTRWYQFGAFSPLYRTHGQFPFREVYNIAPANHPAYKSIVYYTKLRYSMMPYIYSLAGKVHFDDYTIMRALVMDFTADKNTHNIGDQFMFGPSFMVAPVYTYKATSRDVYFPTGAGWYDYENNKFIDGGQTLKVAAPYERIPLYVRAGAIVPMGGDIQSTAEQQVDLTLKVYAGADGQFSLYEDEGTNYNYEKGDYSTIALTYNDAAKTVTVGNRQGSYVGMPTNRTITVEFISKSGAPVVKQVKYTGAEASVSF